MYELNKAGVELDRWVDDLLDEIKHSDEMSHSYKGSEWKDHKYVKKEDGRYYYPKESAASGAYDNDIEFKKDKIEELYNIKIHHTEALQKAIERGDTASADKYKEYIKNIDAQMDALKEELDNLSSHAHPNFKTPDNARRLTHSELMHYGVGPDDNPPGRGSGRYPKGSGDRPFQHDPNHDAGEKKKGLFSIFKKKDKPVSVEEARRKAEEEVNRPKTKEEIRKENFDRFMTKTNQALDTAKQVRDMAEKGIDIWNTVAAINNTFNNDFEMPMIKRTSDYFKEKADKEAAKIRREQQLEDAKTKRENDLADALRKEQREDAKWEKEFQAKYGKASDDVNVKSKQQEKPKPKQDESKSTESKQETPPERSSETQDWYTPNNIARALLTSTPESRKQAEDTGTKFWMTVVNGGNQALNPSTARESERDYYRDRVNENKRYNDWEAEQQKYSAQRIVNEERARRESAEKYARESAAREGRLKREAQQYKLAQATLDGMIKARDLDREHNNGNNWRHHDKQVTEARDKLEELRKNYNQFRKYL